jgi:asparaginyl-tRNA synthetase
MQDRRIKNILTAEPLKQKIEVRGWLRTRRDARDFSFLEINDGSCLDNLQVIASSDLENFTLGALSLLQAF